MTHVAYQRHVDTARRHLGDPAPVNTCVSEGMDAWPAELGLHTLDTASVTTAEQRARNGYGGWQYVEGTRGIQPGYYGDWDPRCLARSTDRHVCVVESVTGDRWRGIGAGTPSGKVAFQPASGGTNSLAVLRGYFIPPTQGAGGSSKPPAAKPTPVVKPAAKPTSRTYTAVKGDTVWGIAKRFKIGQQALLTANPRKKGQRRDEDFHIISPTLIYPGQQLHIPT